MDERITSRSSWLIVSVVGTRPNIMKMAPVLRQLARRPDRFTSMLVHTGQHYDHEMTSVFVDELGVRAPDFNLGTGSGSHAQQTARVMERLEPILVDRRPDLVLVAGDVNSTAAAALTASKLDVPVAHLEAGLRSFDRSMPEELNRVVTDAVASVHLTHSPEAYDNLIREGADADSIYAVGNTMIDTLLAYKDAPRVIAAPHRYNLDPGSYLLVTLHRPALVDGPLFAEAMAQLSDIVREVPVVFPVHPRTRTILETVPHQATAGIRFLPPLGYHDFVGLLASAAAVLTDSGGIQEETTVLGVRCFTLRNNTERPVTVVSGTNTLLGLDPSRISELPKLINERPHQHPQLPPLWDGRAAERVVDALESFLARGGRPRGT